MKRAFYVDPLAAAWMAKHFGMKLVHYATDDHAQAYGCITGEGWDWPEACPMDGGPEVNTIEDAIAFIEAASPTKIFIHPDSLHLLEPREGDVFKNPDGCDDAPPYIVVRGEIGSILAEITLAENPSARIIQRNGIHLMWPEFEG